MLSSALERTQTDRSRRGCERSDGSLPAQQVKLRLGFLSMQTSFDDVLYKERKDAHPDIESLWPVPLRPMAQVDDGSYKIPQLHACDVQERKIPYTFAAQR